MRAKKYNIIFATAFSLCVLLLQGRLCAQEQGEERPYDYQDKHKQYFDKDYQYMKTKGAKGPVLDEVKKVMDRAKDIKAQEYVVDRNGRASSLIFTRQTVEEIDPKTAKVVRGKLMQVLDRSENTIFSCKTILDEKGREISRLVKLGEIEIIYDIKERKKIGIKLNTQDDKYLDWDSLEPDARKDMLGIKMAFEKLIKSFDPLSEKYEKKVASYYLALEKELNKNKKTWWDKEIDPYSYYAGDDLVLDENERRAMVDDAVRALGLISQGHDQRSRSAIFMLKKQKKLKKEIEEVEEEFERSLNSAISTLKTRTDNIIAKAKRSIYQKQPGGSTVLIVLPEK